MKERKIIVDDIEYTVTLSKGNVLRINGSIYRTSTFGNEIDKKVNEYNFQFAPDFMYVPLRAGFPYGNDMNPKMKKMFMELFTIAVETNTALSDNSIDEIYDDFIGIDPQDGNS
tara:strand:+ start:3838 stop:4179 length:342 start_codon:yes stop_codon:yes gene_type:complete